MKRKALLAGLRVGLFEEVHTREQVHHFMDLLNEANLQLPGEQDSWVHLKPFAAAGGNRSGTGDYPDSERKDDTGSRK
ncbi:MAG: hypothetical protein ACNA8K_12630 [Cyclonatronaceae bacterium]